MTQEQTDQVKAIHEHLSKSNESSWPRQVWGSEDHYAFFLERLLARAIGNRPVVLASAKVVKDDQNDVVRFEAAIFTDRLIITGGIDVEPATDERGMRRPHPRHGDVGVIPRSNIKAVTLHDVDNFGEHGDGGPDVISFTVDVDGHAPIVLPMPRYNHALSGDHSQLFDALLDDLDTKRQAAIVQ
ncbi:hypothetical protein [Arthrobacter sp. H35-D1]|uniref:hypothetical protein n=1 Tax=Arthrobacter sp. H35-D1 TaxID=3046202 RepID=UPI0024B9589C|nr:hypothetical protein [Arthrobacter sp. H35-D1]MDJ0314494.1 hypothetical protein [Arthrobacter sp. H35-D1]